MMFGKWHLGAGSGTSPQGQKGFDVNVGGNHRGIHLQLFLVLT